jgi:CheY-like chemotaxis protein
MSAITTPVLHSRSTVEDEGPIRHFRILVVDDNDINREIARSFVSAAGYEVDCVEGGVQAFAAAAERDYDAVLMDVRMPKMDGLEATRRIRLLPGLRGRVPIVAVTAQAFAEQIEECKNAGMNDHLAKPFTQERLLHVLDDTIAEHNACSEAGSALETEQLFNAKVFQQAASFLPSGIVVSYVQTITRHSKSLLSALQTLDNIGNCADEAHDLAGSAGMFGFDRLAATAREFDHAVRNVAADTPALAANLRSVIEDTLRLLQRHDSPVWTGKGDR